MRFLTGTSDIIKEGIVVDVKDAPSGEADIVEEISGGFFGEIKKTGVKYRLDNINLAAPCNPSKVVAVGMNYLDHIKELGNRDIPESPVLFIKLPHTVIGPGEGIIFPEGATRVDYEGELAIVISKECYKVGSSEISSYVLGATCLNDVTERDMQKKDGQWTRAKNFSTFCPIGPWIADGLNYDKLDICLRLNDEVKQRSNTLNLLFKTSDLISFISHIMPLYPGDIVTTGTPYGVSPMKPGDVVEVEIEGIGVLRNHIKESH
ncbi:MAG: fumarylacetoacetate hydrolase family protein [Clostridiales bacterium]|nr:fumarylacetoacetate hydrolase family protein [Clostridiales bacterium]